MSRKLDMKLEHPEHEAPDDEELEDEPVPAPAPEPVPEKPESIAARDNTRGPWGTGEPI